MYGKQLSYGGAGGADFSPGLRCLPGQVSKRPPANTAHQLRGNNQRAGTAQKAWSVSPASHLHGSLARRTRLFGAFQASSLGTVVRTLEPQNFKSIEVQAGARE